MSRLTWRSLKGLLALAIFEFGGLKIGEDYEPQVVAEIGINHGGKIDVALSIAKSAIKSGVRLIKHQTHIPDAEMSVEAQGVFPGNADLSIYNVIADSTLSESDEHRLKTYVESQGAIFFSTPFSREAADRLEDWGVPGYKIGSGECNNYPLVDYIASKGKPIILSTGMNTIESIQKSVAIMESHDVRFALLHTTNLYPTPVNLIRLGAISELREKFSGTVIGLSDHSTSNSSCIASVALGARILERHFVDSRRRKGPDVPCSMNEKEARNLIEESRNVFLASGGSKGYLSDEQVTTRFAFSSVVATTNISEGEALGANNIWVKRPSGGAFPAEQMRELFGQRAARLILANHQIQHDDLRTVSQ